MSVVVVRAVVVVRGSVAEDIVKVVVSHSEVFVGSAGLSVDGIKVAVGSVIAVDHGEVGIGGGSMSGSLPLVVSNILS